MRERLCKKERCHGDQARVYEGCKLIIHKAWEVGIIIRGGLVGVEAGAETRRGPGTKHRWQLTKQNVTAIPGEKKEH